jgi:hypothetical protein
MCANEHKTSNLGGEPFTEGAPKGDKTIAVLMAIENSQCAALSANEGTTKA